MSYFATSQRKPFSRQFLEPASQFQAATSAVPLTGWGAFMKEHGADLRDPGIARPREHQRDGEDYWFMA